MSYCCVDPSACITTSQYSLKLCKQQGIANAVPNLRLLNPTFFLKSSKGCLRSQEAMNQNLELGFCFLPFLKPRDGNFLSRSKVNQTLVAVGDTEISWRSKFYLPMLCEEVLCFFNTNYFNNLMIFFFIMTCVISVTPYFVFLKAFFLIFLA